MTFKDKLAELGFTSYRDYCKSPLWAGIRSRVFDLKGRTCLKCLKAKATQIHHERYELEVMRGLDLSPLVPICGPCHEAQHPDKVRARRPKKAKPKKRKARRDLATNPWQIHNAAAWREPKPKKTKCPRCGRERKTIALRPAAPDRPAMCGKCAEQFSRKQAAERSTSASLLEYRRAIKATGYPPMIAQLLLKARQSTQTRSSESQSPPSPAHDNRTSSNGVVTR